ncbi:MAG: ATP-binding cassette domain-containing protein [Phycisphaeraceae bacterium]|nr:ATP-binding cassette domain-containing protein [Phycisphaeraceae bacterium]
MTAILTTTPAPIPAPPTADAVIRCAGLTKIFKDFWLRNRVTAVDAIDLEVRRGEVFGLLGPNGSGKSTTIKMILGLLHPTAGRIAVFGKRPDDVATKKQIGYLPEESYLYRFLNARETLEYYGRLFHQNADQRRRRIDQLLQFVGLEAVQRRPVGEYSKGMQRRIGLAQALINDPQLLILDEPTTGMDPIGTRQIKDLILELARRGKTILLCSHLLADVEDVCDRVAIMFGGKVRAQGTVDELLLRQDMTTIQTEALDVETIQEVEALLEKHGKSIDRVEQPRQKLESLFLEIVQQAQAEGATTSGARSGGKIAEFLTSGPATQSDEPDNVIEQLVSAPQPSVEPANQEPAIVEPASPQPDNAVLNSLIVPTNEPAEATAPPSPQVAVIPSAATALPTTPKPAPPEPEQTPVVTAAPPASQPPPVETQRKTTGEQPDQAFIEALTKVEPFKGDEPAKSSGHDESRS